MSSLLSLLLHAAPAFVETVAVATPQSLTQPRLQFECNVSDENGRRYRVLLERRGGRGYWVQTNNPQNPSERFVRKTPFFLRVAQDQTGMLSELSLPELKNDLARGFLFRDSGGNVRAALRIFGKSFDHEPARMIVSVVPIYDQTPGFTGFCDKTPQPQAALDEQETAAHKNKLESFSAELDALAKAKKLAGTR